MGGTKGRRAQMHIVAASGIARHGVHVQISARVCFPHVVDLGTAGRGEMEGESGTLVRANVTQRMGGATCKLLRTWKKSSSVTMIVKSLLSVGRSTGGAGWYAGDSDWFTGGSGWATGGSGWVTGGAGWVTGGAGWYTEAEFAAQDQSPKLAPSDWTASFPIRFPKADL